MQISHALVSSMIFDSTLAIGWYHKTVSVITHSLLKLLRVSEWLRTWEGSIKSSPNHWEGIACTTILNGIIQMLKIWWTKIKIMLISFLSISGWCYLQIIFIIKLFILTRRVIISSNTTRISFFFHFFLALNIFNWTTLYHLLSYLTNLLWFSGNSY